MFRSHEHAIWGTDAGWTRLPSYARQRILGSSSDVITTLAIGSAERSFEVVLTPDRFNSLELLLSTKGLLTDWSNPTPDSRMAVLTEIVAIEDVISDIPTGIAGRKRRARLTFVTV